VGQGLRGDNDHERTIIGRGEHYGGLDRVGYILKGHDLQIGPIPTIMTRRAP
jgi:hypothetical protein